MNIDRAETLRYLGYGGQELAESLDGLIDEAIARCARLARPRSVHRVFRLVWDAVSGDAALPEAGLALTGGAIRRYLNGAAGGAVLAATIGGEIEAEIRAAQISNPPLALALDAAATACVESVCDGAAEGIAREAARDGLYPGARFSPGYGDLPLSLQPGILRALDAGRKIGLTCTDHLILLPRKSVTAFIGLFESPRGMRRPGCAECPLRGRCGYRVCERRGPGEGGTG